MSLFTFWVSTLWKISAQERACQIKFEWFTILFPWLNQILQAFLDICMAILAAADRVATYATHPERYL